MRAIDTNVLVRYLTGDEPGQAARARTAIDAGNVFVSTSALCKSTGYGPIFCPVSPGSRASRARTGASEGNSRTVAQGIVNADADGVVYPVALAGRAIARRPRHRRWQAL